MATSPAQRATSDAIDDLIVTHRDVLGPHVPDEDGEPTEEPAPGQWAPTGWVLVVEWQYLGDEPVPDDMEEVYLQRFTQATMSPIHVTGLVYEALEL